jgi:tetratricopeptide (TPR) repeat protein
MTPLVGRNAELTQLCTCYDRLAESLSQVVEIIGDAGSGKSRLVYEFKQRVAADGGGSGPAAFFEARCSALSQAVPYAPWIGMIRQHFALLPGEDATSARAKIADGVRAIDPDLDTIFPYLSRLLSLPGDDCGCVPSDELKPQTFAAIGKLIHATSLRMPVVIVVEDLHWIDDESRAMLDLAVGKMHDERTMLVVTHRPDYHPFWRSPAAFTQLNLRPLAADDATTIVRSVAGGRLPAKLEQKILARADGNPFFLEEITRALIEGGALLRGDGHIRLTRPVAQIGIPDTVQELIAARLDRLGPDAKRVAQVAAVLGRQFHRVQLAHLLAPEGIDVARALETLESRGVIHRKNVLSPDEYRFGESLAQEVAYEALLLKERRQLHERIGFLLEADGSETDAERAALLAHHFARSDNWEKAIAALLHAAQRAEALPSYTTAVNLYRQAWALADATLNAHPDDGRVERWTMDAGFGLARVAVLYGPSHLAEAEAAARRGRALAEKLGALDTLAGLCTFHGLIIMNGERERFAEGLAIAEEGLAVAQRARLETSVISISRGLAWAYLIDGQFELAHRTIAWVMQDLERLGHRAQLSDLFFGCRWVQSGIRYHSDEREAAHAQAVEDYELAIQSKNRTSQGGVSAVLAEIAFDRGEYADAVRFAERSLEIAHAISSLAGVRTAAAIALAARIELGESGFETPYIESIEEGLAQGGTLPVNSRLVTDALLAAGDLDRARRIAELAYARGGGRLREALATSSLGDVMFRLGPTHWGEAERWYRQAIGMAQAIGARSAHAAALLGAGELAAARGEREPAERQLRQALTVCAELGLARLHARGERALADLSADVPQQA